MIRPFLKWFRRILLALVVALLLLVSLSSASNLGLKKSSEHPAELSPVQEARVAEAFRLRESLGNTVWPGWAEVQIPQIVYNEAFAFLVGLPDPPAGWYEEPGHGRRGGNWEALPEGGLFPGSYFRQSLDTIRRGPQAFAVRVGDRWAGSVPTQEWSRISLGREIRSQLPGVLEWIPPYRLLGRLFFRGAEHQVSLILHESFHAFQGMQAEERLAGAESALGVEGEYPWNAPEMIGRWDRELGLLADALMEDTGSGAEALIREFLMRRKERRKLLSPKLVSFEDDREWLEGLAKFVELKSTLVARRAASMSDGGPGKHSPSPGLWEDPRPSPYTPHPAMAEDPEFNGYDGAGKAFSREVSQLRRVGGQGEVRFYYSGMAMAFLLDRLGPPDWKSRIMESNLSLSVLLSEAVPTNGVGRGSDTEELTTTGDALAGSTS